MTFEQLTLRLDEWRKQRNLADPVLKDAIIVLAVINTVTVFFTVPVLRRDLYRKRWYLALTTAYTLVEFAVVVWIFIYRLGEML